MQLMSFNFVDDFNIEIIIIFLLIILKNKKAWIILIIAHHIFNIVITAEYFFIFNEKLINNQLNHILIGILKFSKLFLFKLLW